MADTLQVHITSQNLATIILNNPERHNAFDDAVIQQLTLELKKLDRSDIRAVILSATGKSFCAGADLQWMQRTANYTKQQNLQDSLALADLMHTLYCMQPPTIAVVQGSAFGGGVGLVACCDIAVASNQAVFSFSEVRLGLIPAVISPYVIAAIGTRQATHYFITGKHISAEEALKIGLVHYRVEEDELPNQVTEIVQHILQNSPQAIIASKKLIHDVKNLPIDKTLINETAKRIAEIRVSAEGQEGLQAFLQKRKPKWCPQ